MLGANIAALRRQAGLSQAELARRIGVSPSAMGMYEQGRREPSLELLPVLAAALGVRMEELLAPSLPGMTIPPNTARLLLSVMRNGELPPISREELAVLCVALLIS